jgi:hypothetical protein
MKRLYVCGSFRFTGEMEELKRGLEEKNIECLMSNKMNSPGILGCLKKIDDADVVYVVNPGGYVGKSVSVDIGYAYARNKSIYAMHPIDDPPVMDLINGILSSKELINFLTEGSLVKM